MPSKLSKNVTWLFIIAVVLLTAGIAAFAIGLNTIGLSWTVVRGVSYCFSGAYLFWWGIRIMNKRV